MIQNHNLNSDINELPQYSPNYKSQSFKKRNLTFTVENNQCDNNSNFEYFNAYKSLEFQINLTFSIIQNHNLNSDINELPQYSPNYD